MTAAPRWRDDVGLRQPNRRAASGERGLVRAGDRDLPVLALVAAQAMARQPFGTVFGWPLAIFGWPMWLAMLNLLSGKLWHLERRAMIATRARETSRFPALHLLGGPLVIGTVMGVSLALWPPVFWLGVGSVTAFLLVNVGSYPGRLVAGPRVSHENPPLFISATAAEHQGSGLLHHGRVHLTDQYPGLPQELVARDRDLVAVYSRMLAISRVIPGQGRIIDTVSPRKY